jgi:hypothetical protein
MPIKHKHSPTSGNRANLTPGEIGHNRPEDVLLIRGNLQKLAISLADWRTRGVPLEGTIGAPLTHVGGVLTYDPTLLTAGQVDGGFFTDEPPGLNAWGVPGFVQVQPDFENDIDPDSLLPKTTFAPNDVRIEDFYVASDEINISHIGCRTIYTGAGSPPPIRVGLVNAAGVILAEKRYLSAPSLIAAYVGPLTLTRGTYSLVVWIGGALDLVRVSGERLNLSFEFNGTSISAVRGRAASADMNAGLFVDNGLVITDVTSTEVGEDKHLFVRWFLDTPSLAPDPMSLAVTPTTLSTSLAQGGVATTDPVTVTVTGGSGAFLYAWDSPGLTPSAPDQATTTFTRSLGNGETFDTSPTVTVTDTVTGRTAQIAVPVHLHADTPVSSGGGGGHFLIVTLDPPNGSATAPAGSAISLTATITRVQGINLHTGFLDDLTPDQYTFSFNGDGSGTATGVMAGAGSHMELQVFVAVSSVEYDAIGSAGTTINYTAV